jgi:hypothetical protein
MNVVTQEVFMSAFTRCIDVTTCCTFCGKSLPVVNGQVHPWRASNGQFFCNEFCADDAEEMRFQTHGRVDRKAHNRVRLDSMR